MLGGKPDVRRQERKKTTNVGRKAKNCKRGRGTWGGGVRLGDGRTILQLDGTAHSRLARVWNNYSIPRVEISPGIYIYIYRIIGSEYMH